MERVRCGQENFKIGVVRKYRSIHGHCQSPWEVSNLTKIFKDRMFMYIDLRCSQGHDLCFIDGPLVLGGGPKE